MTAANHRAPKDLVGFLDYYLVGKAPFQIPEAGRQWLATLAPWIAIVLLALFLPLVLVAIGAGVRLAPLAAPTHAVGFGYPAVLILLNIALLAAALPGLFARRMSGWNFLFYAELVQIAAGLLGGSITRALLGGLVALYLLFQIRSVYER